MNHESLVGRLVKDSDGDTLEVVFIDSAVGITLVDPNDEDIKICINGPASPNKTDEPYDVVFDRLVKQIDNWFIDLDELHQEFPWGYDEGSMFIVHCAVGG